MKMIADKAAHCVKNAKHRRFFLFCIARLIECTQLVSAKALYMQKYVHCIPSYAANSSY